MVYMNKATFDMWDLPATAEMEENDSWFSVDEVIAPIIRELNLRGYRTTYCCSGHPITGLLPVYATDEETGEDFCIGEAISYSNLLYIAFDRDYGYTFWASIPDECYVDDECTVLRADLGSELGFALLRKRLDACERLYQWACSLPIIDTSRMLSAIAQHN